MIRNPEFVRNLWLEFKGHRVIAVPVALAAIFLLTALTDSKLGQVTTGNFLGLSSKFSAKAAFIVIVVLWGSRMAAEAVVQEINARTWDGQRMSAIGPWAMVWGKLFGSTSFAWACGGLCLLFYAAVGYSTGDPDGTMWDILLLVQMGLLAHIVALFLSLVALQKGRSPGRSQVTIFQFAGIAAGVMAGQFFPDEILGTTRIDWFGVNYDRSTLEFASIIVFGAWFVAGCYQLMRHELQISTSPLMWLAFVLFSMVYVTGFGIGPEASGLIYELAQNQRFFGAYLVGLVLLYAVALAEPKDRARLRKLREHLRMGDRRKAFDLAPRALVTLPLIAAFGIAAVMIHSGPKSWGPDGLTYVVAAIFLFALRDVGLIYALNIARPSSRANVAAAIYLLLIYAVAPAIFGALGLDAAIIAFRPGTATLSIAGVLAPLIEAAVILAILARLLGRQLASAQEPART